MGLYTFFNAGEVTAAGVCFPIVGAILVAFRIRIRLMKMKRLGIEDWLVFPALALSIGMGIATVYGVAKKSIGYETPHQKGPYQKYTETKAEQVFWNIEWMQPLALGCIKLSFIFFYRRIFNVGKQKSVFNIVSIASIVLIIIWMFGFFLAVLLICPGHVDDYWGPSSVRAQHCWTTTKFLYAFSWSDVGTDLIVLLLPVPPVLHLHVPTHKKIAIVAIFGLGALTVVASILRAVFYVQLLNAEKTVLYTLDPNMLNTNGIYWMLIETGLGLVALNLPLLYGSFKNSSGIESVIRSVGSFASIRSRSSNRGQSKDSSLHKTGGESREHITSIELVPGGHHSNSKAMRTESLEAGDLEAGNINVTKSYTVEQREQAT